VIEAAPLFASWNLGALSRRSVLLERRDAYRALLHSSERFGVILSEPPNPWVTGVEMLYSREFLESARARLTPSGVYAQWIHGYESDDATLALVLQTYATVFERTSVWFTRGNEFILLGFNSASGYAPDPMRARFARRDFREGFERCGARTWEELAAHELLPPGVIAPEPGRAVHTLRRPLLSHLAARAFFVGGDAKLPTLAGAMTAPDSPPRGLLASASGFDETTLARVVRHVCASSRPAECATWHAHWASRFPVSALRDLVWRETRAAVAPSPSAALTVVTRLVALYRRTPPEFPGTTRVAAARATTALFTRHYLHAIPFPRDGLRRAWNRCEQGASALGCLDARREAERELTSLSGSGP
jgi:hypothetical protein